MLLNASDSRRQEERHSQPQPRGNMKSTFACPSCQIPLLHSDIYKVGEGGGGEGGEDTCVFQIVIMGIDSPTSLIQNELYDCGE